MWFEPWIRQYGQHGLERAADFTDKVMQMSKARRNGRALLISGFKDLLYPAKHCHCKWCLNWTMWMRCRRSSAHTNQHIWLSFRIYSHYHTKWLIMEMAEEMTCSGYQEWEDKQGWRRSDGSHLCGAARFIMEKKNPAHVNQRLF